MSRPWQQRQNSKGNHSTVAYWPVAAYSRDAEAPAVLKCAADQQKAQTLADRLYWASCPDAGETRRRLEIGDVLKVLAPG
jgi:hypothetical protein